MRRKPRLRLGLACIALAAVAGCINVFWETRATPIAARDLQTGWSVSTPVKVHLKDGSTIVFTQGASTRGADVEGLGMHYPLLADEGRPRSTVPIDSVVGLEAFEGHVLTAPTVIVSAAATALGFAGTVVILKALFGSCPTVYADTGTGPVLEAEGFSYAIAPLLENRDVDRLRTRPDSAGVIRLELRNEALETHFINHIELIGARHRAGARVIPDQSNKLVAVAATRPLASARDRSGRDVRVALRDPDGQLFASDPRVIDRARVGDLDDWLDLEADNLPPGDSVVVVLRLRNSLLNTVLLYEGMLGGRDAAEWMTTRLQELGTLAELARWYTTSMGLRASTGSATARLNDVGPIAFRDVAIVLPRSAPGARRASVRLRFVADNWRIDYAAIGGDFARPSEFSIPLHRVVVPTPASGGPSAIDAPALTALARMDDRYLETRPGQRMTLEFVTPRDRASGDTASSYFIAWQGWYREWLRPAWMQRPTRVARFVPGDSAVLTALRRWRERQADLEKKFYASPIPVR